MYWSSSSEVPPSHTSHHRIGFSCFKSRVFATSELKVKIYKTICLPLVLYECQTWSLTVGGVRASSAGSSTCSEKCWGCSALERTLPFLAQHASPSVGLLLLLSSFLLQSTLVLNSALPFWKFLVSEFLQCSKSALQVKIVPLLDVHQLLILFARMLTYSEPETFTLIIFIIVYDRYYYYYYHHHHHHRHYFFVCFLFKFLY
jgi:hypothetical protein